MKNGKYSNKNRKRRLRWGKEFVLLCSVVMLLIGVVGGSLAYLIAEGGSVENTFIPGKVSCSIQEPGWSDGETTKSNVTVKNTGNTDAYIRAAIVVTWEKDGAKAPVAPVLGTDYTLVINTAAWTKNGSYYYHNTAVAPDKETEVLINSCTVTGTYEDYTLCVEILADAIQSTGVDTDGSTPVSQAWGYPPSGN